MSSWSLPGPEGPCTKLWAWVSKAPVESRGKICEQLNMLIHWMCANAAYFMSKSMSTWYVNMSLKHIWFLLLKRQAVGRFRSLKTAFSLQGTVLCPPFMFDGCSLEPARLGRMSLMEHLQEHIPGMFRHQKKRRKSLLQSIWWPGEPLPSFPSSTSAKYSPNPGIRCDIPFASCR